MAKIMSILGRLLACRASERQGKVSWQLVVLLAVAVVLAVSCVRLYLDYLQPPAGGAYLGKTMVFKCTSCGKVARYTLGEVREMIKGPLSSPVVLDCEQCGQRTLTQAAECPQCGEVFVILLTRPDSDICPNCGTGYLNLLRRKQGQANQEQE